MPSRQKTAVSGGALLFTERSQLELWFRPQPCLRHTVASAMLGLALIAALAGPVCSQTAPVTVPPALNVPTPATGSAVTGAGDPAGSEKSTSDKTTVVEPQRAETPRERIANFRDKLGSLRPPEGTRIERDLAYIPNGHERQKLDLYIPPGEGPFPIVVWVHGGAWKQGDKGRIVPAMNALHDGIAVASINYRLSPQAVFPAQIQDCQAAIRWLRAEGSKFKLDPTRIVAWGASAGGHLVALLGTAADSAEWEAIGPHRDQSAKVSAVIDWFGPSDFSLFSATAVARNSAIGDLLGVTADETTESVRQKGRRASPVSFVSEGDAPFLIMQGDTDPLVPLRQSERLHEALKDRQIPCELVILKGAGHGTPDFVAEPMRAKIRAFLQQHLQQPLPATR